MSAIPQLFAHQKVSLQRLTKQPIIFDTSDPGTGKTPVQILDFAARRRKGGKCLLVLATRSLLTSAWEADFKKFAPDMKVSIAFAENRAKAFAVPADVYVTNHDAANWLVEQPASFFAKFDTLVVDECFPAGTLVDTPLGQRRIEELKVGDLVFTSEGGLPISKTFIKSTNDLVRLEFEDGTTLECTANHLFATTEGWVEARSTRGVSVVRLHLHKLYEQGADLLRQKLFNQSNVVEEDAGRTSGYISEKRTENTRKTELEQMDSLQGENKSPSECWAQGDWTSTLAAWRQWKNRSLRTNDVGNASEVLGVSTCNSNWAFSPGRTPECVQGGLRDTLEEMGDRGGRKFSYIAKTLGCEERFISGVSRVVRVSSVECPSKTLVYNIQVDGPHNYSVGGLLVHNCTAFKHHTSQRSKSVGKIAPRFKWRRLLTGTPNSNGVCDLWHQIYLLDNGQRLGKSFFAFRKAACDAIKIMDNPIYVKDKVTGQLKPVTPVDWVDKESIELTVAALIRDITIRNKFEDCVDIPPNHQYARSFKLSRAHMKAYETMRDNRLLQLKKTTVTAINAAAVAGKLLQISSGACYDDDGEGAHSLIDSARYELILDLVEEREHSIVFFNWVHQRDELIKEATRRGISFAVYDGTTSTRDRTPIVKDYQAGKYRVLFAHPQSAGHGLTLTKGTATIWASPTYNLEHFLQGLKRIHRIGQIRKTETIVIVAEGTIDEVVWQALQDKHVKLVELLEGLK